MECNYFTGSQYFYQLSQCCLCPWTMDSLPILQSTHGKNGKTWKFCQTPPIYTKIWFLGMKFLEEFLAIRFISSFSNRLNRRPLNCRCRISGVCIPNIWCSDSCWCLLKFDCGFYGLNCSLCWIWTRKFTKKQNAHACTPVPRGVGRDNRSFGARLAYKFRLIHIHQDFGFNDGNIISNNMFLL